MNTYLPPVELLCDSLGISLDELMGDGKISVAAEALRLLIKTTLSAVAIDTVSYADANEDLKAKFGRTNVEGLQSHFAFHGYFEGRQIPWSTFDQAYYARKNPDVSEAVRLKSVPSLLEHYRRTGVYESRAPTESLEFWVAQWSALPTSAKERAA